MAESPAQLTPRSPCGRACGVNERMLSWICRMLLKYSLATPQEPPGSIPAGICPKAGDFGQARPQRLWSCSSPQGSALSSGAATALTCSQGSAVPQSLGCGTPQRGFLCSVTGHGLEGKSLAVGSRTSLSISRSYLTLRHEENTQEEFCLLSRKESQYSWLKMSPPACVCSSADLGIHRNSFFA